MARILFQGNHNFTIFKSGMITLDNFWTATILVPIQSPELELFIGIKIVLVQKSSTAFVHGPKQIAPHYVISSKFLRPEPGFRSIMILQFSNPICFRSIIFWTATILRPIESLDHEFFISIMIAFVQKLSTAFVEDSKCIAPHYVIFLKFCGRNPDSGQQLLQNSWTRQMYIPHPDLTILPAVLYSRYSALCGLQGMIYQCIPSTFDRKSYVSKIRYVVAADGVPTIRYVLNIILSKFLRPETGFWNFWSIMILQFSNPVRFQSIIFWRQRFWCRSQVLNKSFSSALRSYS